MATTGGHLLGGRIQYRQPASGFRSGIEPVLLAASVPARPGDHVLEAGCGAGAAMLCLAHRVPGVRVTGVELQPAMAGLARANAGLNGFADIAVITDCIETGRLAHVFDHAMANPPYHQPDGTLSPDLTREIAKRGSGALIAAWIDRLSAALRRRGSLTLVVPAGMVPACLAAMAESRCPCTSIFPLWPKAGRPAKLVLLRGIKEARTPLRVMAGMVLHRADGSYSEVAQAVLAEGAGLPLETGRSMTDGWT